MNMIIHRDKMAVFILFSNIGLFVVVFLSFLLNGITTEEMKDILKYLVPVKSFYLTVVIKYILKDPVVVEPPAAPVPWAKASYRLMTKVFIYVHITALYAIIILYSLGGRSFDLISSGIPIIESFWGIPVGIIVSDMFMSKRSDGPVSGDIM